MWRREPLGLLLLAMAAAAAAGPALGDAGGSGDGDEAALASAAPATMAAAPSEAPGEARGGLAAFVRDYALLAAVAGSLALALLLLPACAALLLLLRRRRKAAAYYPCSFPAKQYVDARDRAGGARGGFGELPAAAPGPRARQPAGLLPTELEEAARGLRPPGARRHDKGAHTEPGGEPSAGGGGDAGADAEMPPAEAEGAMEGGDGRAALA